jgi:hypothetical protein
MIGDDVPLEDGPYSFAWGHTPDYGLPYLRPDELTERACYPVSALEAISIEACSDWLCLKDRAYVTSVFCFLPPLVKGVKKGFERERSVHEVIFFDLLVREMGLRGSRLNFERAYRGFSMFLLLNKGVWYNV